MLFVVIVGIIRRNTSSCQSWLHVLAAWLCLLLQSQAHEALRLSLSLLAPGLCAAALRSEHVQFGIPLTRNALTAKHGGRMLWVSAMLQVIGVLAFMDPYEFAYELAQLSRTK